MKVADFIQGILMNKGFRSATSLCSLDSQAASSSERVARRLGE